VDVGLEGVYVVRQSGRCDVLRDSALIKTFFVPGGPFPPGSAQVQGDVLILDGRAHPLPFSIIRGIRDGARLGEETRSRQAQVGDMSLLSPEQPIGLGDGLVRSCKVWLRRADPLSFLGDTPSKEGAAVCVRDSSDESSIQVLLQGHRLPELTSPPSTGGYTAVMTASAPFQMQLGGLVSTSPPVPAGTQATVYGYNTEPPRFFWVGSPGDIPQSLSGVSSAATPAPAGQTRYYRGNLPLYPTTRQISLIRSGGNLVLLARPHPATTRVRVLPSDASITEFRNESGQVVSGGTGPVYQFNAVVSLGSITVDRVGCSIQFWDGVGAFGNTIRLGDNTQVSLNSFKSSSQAGQLDAELDFRPSGATARLYAGLDLVSGVSCSYSAYSEHVESCLLTTQGARVVSSSHPLTPLHQSVCVTAEPRTFSVLHNLFRAVAVAGGNFASAIRTWPHEAGGWLHFTMNRTSSPASQPVSGPFGGFVDDLSLFRDESVQEGEGVVTGSRDGYNGGLSKATEYGSPLDIPVPAPSGAVAYMVKSIDLNAAYRVAEPFEATAPSPPGAWHHVAVTSAGDLYVNGVLVEQKAASPPQTVSVNLNGNVDTVKTFSPDIPGDMYGLAYPRNVMSSGNLTFVGFAEGLFLPQSQSGSPSDFIELEVGQPPWTARILLSRVVAGDPSSQVVTGVALSDLPAAGGVRDVVIRSDGGLFCEGAFVRTLLPSSETKLRIFPGPGITRAGLQTAQAWATLLTAPQIAHLHVSSGEWRFATLAVPSPGAAHSVAVSPSPAPPTIWREDGVLDHFYGGEGGRRSP
jgi:hypothetical protein